MKRTLAEFDSRMAQYGDPEHLFSAHGWFTLCCDLAASLRALIACREPVEVDGNESVVKRKCGNCGNQPMSIVYDFCPNCGRTIKWTN